MLNMFKLNIIAFRFCYLITLSTSIRSIKLHFNILKFVLHWLEQQKYKCDVPKGKLKFLCIRLCMKYFCVVSRYKVYIKITRDKIDVAVKSAGNPPHLYGCIWDKRSSIGPSGHAVSGLYHLYSTCS